MQRNKTILATSLIVILVAISVIAIYNLGNQIIKAQTPQLNEKDITISLSKRMEKYRENITTQNDGQWSVTIKSLDGKIKAIAIHIVNLDNWRTHSTKWVKLDPSVGDSFTVNLPAGKYKLIILVAGQVNSKITVTLVYP
ncbi:MAG: hypothetical protein ACO2OV_09100 [Thermoproteota archaeon]|jgi:hypothetical protein